MIFSLFVLGICFIVKINLFFNYKIMGDNNSVNSLKSLFNDGDKITKSALPEIEIDTIISGKEKEQTGTENQILILQTKNGNLEIPYKATGISFLKDNQESIDFSLIKELFGNYDGSIESINTIFEVLKNHSLERLKKFDGNINEIFGEEFRELVKQLNNKFQETEKLKNSYIKINSGNRIKNFFVKITLNFLGESVSQILDNIKNTSKFVIEANSKIDKEEQKANILENSNKQEFKFLLTQYSSLLILKFLIEKKLNNNTKNKTLAIQGDIIQVNYQKELLKARLDGIKAQLSTIVIGLKMSDGVSKEIGTTTINLKSSYENLIGTLNILINIVQGIHTLNNINDISTILQNLKKISLDETSKAYINLLNQKVKIIEEEINFQKHIQDTIKETIQIEEHTTKEIEIKKQKLQKEQEESTALENKVFEKLQNPNLDK